MTLKHLLVMLLQASGRFPVIHCDTRSLPKFVFCPVSFFSSLSPHHEAVP